VHTIVAPDLDMAVRLAGSLISTSILDSIPLTGRYSIVQVKAPSYMIGRTLRELDLRREHNVNLITIKRRPEKEAGNEMPEEIIGVPMPETRIEKHDVLILMGEQKNVERLVKE
jgi:trk system potassium uptake protein TrkA